MDGRWGVNGRGFRAQGGGSSWRGGRIGPEGGEGEARGPGEAGGGQDVEGASARGFCFSVTEEGSPGPHTPVLLPWGPWRRHPRRGGVCIPFQS